MLPEPHSFFPPGAAITRAMLRRASEEQTPAFWLVVCDLMRGTSGAYRFETEEALTEFAQLAAGEDIALFMFVGTRLPHVIDVPTMGPVSLSSVRGPVRALELHDGRLPNADTFLRLVRPHSAQADDGDDAFEDEEGEPCDG